MNEEYLWDRSSGPDPETAHLESILGEFKWSGRMPSAREPKRRRWHKQPVAAMAAAAVLVCLGAVWLQRNLSPATSWRLSFAGGGSNLTRSGEIIETTHGLSATLISKSYGEVNIEPDSRLRLIGSPRQDGQIALDRGTIHAFIWAPPAQFVVRTPSARTIDLGCQYTLSVAQDGNGFLAVQMGWVAFEWHGIQSFIPAGAACSTRIKYGPETPYFLDAPPALIHALSDFDATADPEALSRALAAARPRDALSLWHLLQRTRGPERDSVFDRFAALVTLPPAVTREAILHGDQTAMDAAWNSLQLGDTSWWRKWQRPW